MYSLDLTVKNEFGGGFCCRHEDVTEKQLMQAFKRCLNVLRKKAKSKKRQWRYVIYAVTSNIHLSWHGTKGSWHIHALILGSPASIITQELKNYWTAHWYGLPKQQCIKKCWNGGKLPYIEAQKSHSFLQSCNISPEELGLDKINRQNIRALFSDYKP